MTTLQAGDLDGKEVSRVSTIVFIICNWPTIEISYISLLLEHNCNQIKTYIYFEEYNFCIMALNMKQTSNLKRKQMKSIDNKCPWQRTKSNYTSVTNNVPSIEIWAFPFPAAVSIGFGAGNLEKKMETNIISDLISNINLAHSHTWILMDI